MATKKKVSLSPSERLAALTPTRVMNWRAHLTDEQRKDLDEIRTDFLAGRYQHAKNFIYRWCREDFNLRVSPTTFVHWLEKKDE